MDIGNGDGRGDYGNLRFGVVWWVCAVVVVFFLFFVFLLIVSYI